MKLLSALGFLVEQTLSALFAKSISSFLLFADLFETINSITIFSLRDKEKGAASQKSRPYNNKILGLILLLLLVFTIYQIDHKGVILSKKNDIYETSPLP